jgi:hypothetical protein
MISINTFSNHVLDQILELQIKIARAGEKHRLSWWNVDATDTDGGGDFFKMLVGRLSEMSAIEIALVGARLLEKEKIKNARISFEVLSIFNPGAEITIQLSKRWEQLKVNPEIIPDIIKSLLDHNLEFDKEGFQKELETFTKPSYEKTALGRMVRGQLSEDPLKGVQQLASLLIPFEENNYPFPYFPIKK